MGRHPQPSPALANFTLMMEIYARKRLLLLCVLCVVDCPVFTAGDLTTVVSLQPFAAAGDQTPVWEDLVLVQNYEL